MGIEKFDCFGLGPALVGIEQIESFGFGQSAQEVRSELQGCKQQSCPSRIRADVVLVPSWNLQFKGIHQKGDQLLKRGSPVC